METYHTYVSGLLSPCVLVNGFINTCWGSLDEKLLENHLSHTNTSPWFSKAEKWLSPILRRLCVMFCCVQFTMGPGGLKHLNNETERILLENEF